ncbi:MAG: PAS domain S-box protein [Actinomycetota bacterium]
MAEQPRHRTTPTAPRHDAVADRTAARHALRAAHAAGRRPAVIHLDIDRLHEINAAWGQRTGDCLLELIGVRLAEALPSSAMVTAPQGGAFLVVLADESCEGSRASAEVLCAIVSKPVVIEGRSVTVTACAGLACDDGSEGDLDLIEQAFLACRRAKAAGPGTIAAYDDSLEVKVERRRRRADDLRRAIADGQLRLVVQPEVDLRDGQVEGVEALVRWQHPTEGLLAPASFLADVEALGLMIDLGTWVLDESIMLASRWRTTRNGAPMRVWVNLAAQQLVDGERVLDRITSALELDLIEPQSIGFEVTESSLLEDLPNAVGTLSALRALGIEIALDDFGTGYSSLTYLRELPVTAVKIDRKFVAGIGGSLADEAIVEAVIDLAHALGLRVVAEGIEDVAHVDALMRLGADHAQGYHFGMPATPAEVEPLLKLPWCGADPPGPLLSSIDRRADELPGFGSPRARLLLAAFDSVHDAVVVTAAHGGATGAPIVYVNAAFESETGFAAIDVVGNTVEMLLPDEPDPSVMEWFEEVHEARSGATMEMAVARADGSLYLCETTLSPIIDERGVHTHWLHVRRDLTQRRAAEGDRARFEGLIEQTKAFVFLADADGALLYMNAALRAVLGLGGDDRLVDVSARSIFAAEESERIDREVVPALREHRRWSGDGTLVDTTTGARTEVVSDIQLVDDPLHPGVQLIASVSRDVSEVKSLERAERRRRELGSFAALVASRALDVGHDEFFDHIDRLLGEFGSLLGADRVYVDRIDIDSGVIEPLGGWSSARYPAVAEPVSLSIDKVPRWIERLREGGVIVGSPLLGRSPWAGELAAAYQFNPSTARLTASLRVGGELVGALGLASVEAEHIWSSDEIDAVQSVGDILANLLARRSAAEALRTSEATLGAMFANVGELLFVLDRKGIVRYVNARVEAVLGRPPRALIGRPFAVLVDRADRATAFEAFRRTTLGEVPPSLELRLVCRDGRVVWFDVETQGVFDPVVGGYTVSLRDDSLRHEQQLLAERRTAFDAVASALSRWALAVPTDDIVPQLGNQLGSLGRLLQADSAYVSLFDDDGCAKVAGWAADELPSSIAEPAPSKPAAGDRSVSALVERCRTLTTLVVDDIHDHVGAWVDEWMSFPVPDRAGVNVPLVAEGRCFGNLGVAMTHVPRAWAADEVALVERVSETVSTLLAHEHAEVSLRNSEMRLSALLDGAHDLVVVVDHEGVVTYVNGTVESSLGYRPADIIGTNIVGYIYPDDVDQALERLYMLHSGAATPMTIVRVIAADGSLGWWEISSGAERVPLVGGRVLTCRDVTERVERERTASRWVEMLRYAFEVAQSALDLAPAAFLDELPATCARIAAIIAVDLVYVDRLDPATGRLAEIAGYSLPDTSTAPRPPQNVAFGDLPSWLDRVRDVRPIVIRDASVCLEPWAEEKRRVLLPEGGLMAVPLSSGGELLGVVGASMFAAPRDWTDDEVTFLRIVSETIAHVLERERLDVALRASEARFRLLSDTAADMVILVDLEGRITYASPSSRQLLGFTPEQLVGSYSRSFIHPADRKAGYVNAELVLERGWTMSDMRLRRADGSYVWVANSTSVVSDPVTGAPMEYRASLRDVSDRKRLEEELERQVLHDPLTGLGNRTLLKNRIDEVISRLGSTAHVSVLSLDLDGFKEVNDTYGHAGGDEVLRQVAARLHTVCRPTDTLARTGGDEFVIFCPDADERAAVSIADRIVFVMSAPIVTPEFEFTLGVSVGVANGSGGSVNTDWLLLEADHAMYEAKRAGKGRVAVTSAHSTSPLPTT